MDLCLEPPTKKIRSAAGDGGEGSESPPERVDWFNYLPRDVVIDILSRLPATSIAQFSFVCRSWRSLTRDPQLPQAQLARTAKHDPYLVLHCDCPIRNQFCFVELSALAGDSAADTPADASVRSFTAPTEDFEVVGMCNGLMCLWDSLYREAHYVYNPFTGDKLRLPEAEQFPNQEVAYGFGADLETNTYKVLRIVYFTYSPARRGQPPLTEVQILTVGEPKWRSLGTTMYQVARRPAEAVLLHGRLHWMTRQRRFRPAPLVAFDLAEEVFTMVPKPENGALNWRNYQLTALGGCLCAAVYYNYGRVDIWVMKVYGEGDTWQREYTIGAHVPKGLRPGGFPPLKLCKTYIRRVRAICIMEKTGEILLEYKGKAFMAYDPEAGKFRDISLKGTPNWFQSYVNMGTLCWIGND